MIKLLLVFLLLYICCTKSSNEIAGGSTDTGNSILIGAVFDKNGIKEVGAIVTLVPENYNPLLDLDMVEVYKDTTDEDGMYKIEYNNVGKYNIQIIDNVNSISRLTQLNKYDESDNIADTVFTNDTLKAVGSIEIRYYYNIDTVNTYAFIKGSTYYIDFRNKKFDSNGYYALTFSGLPSQEWLNLYIYESTEENVISENVWIEEGDTTYVLYKGKE